MFFHSRLLTGSFKRDTIIWRGTTMQKQTNEIDFREEKEGLFMERQTVQIFWTGGMDSTLRIVQLSQLEVNVLPVYIMRANGRKTAVEELTAMGKIYEIPAQKPHCCRFGLLRTARTKFRMRFGNSRFPIPTIIENGMEKPLFD